MADAHLLITENIDIWTTAINKRSATGRGSNKKIELTGIKKLRELILELAVRGKLVPQDPNDEPASVLLEKIAAEKKQLIKDKKIKKPKVLPEIGEDEKPFGLPDGWGVIRLGNAINVINGRAYKKHEMLQEGTPLLRVGNLFTSNEWYYSDLELEPEKYIDNGDLIYSWSASFGPFIWDGGKVIYHYHIWKMDIFAGKSLDKFYMKHYLEAISASIKASGNGIAMIHMTKERMEKLILPIPPFSEQRKIAAKIDELMTLCDQLEQQTEDSITAHQTLVETLLATLTNSENAEEFNQNWTRIAEHFDTLFTTEHSIDQLKQTVLQLAVMGKLVPQNPSDEPASVLLEKIAAEKEQLINDKKIKKQKSLPVITEDEKPFGLPNGWEWARVGDLLSLKNGYAFKSKFFVENKSEYILATPGNFYEEGGFRHRGEKTKYYDGPIDSEFVLKSGDLIIPMTEQAAGLLGSAAFVPKDQNKYLHNQRLGKLSPYSNFTTLEFIFLFFNSSFLREELARTCTGMKVRHTSPDRILIVLIPVIPLKEQHLIVKKVDELMTLCDQLKAKLSDAQTTELQLAETIVKQAVN